MKSLGIAHSQMTSPSSHCDSGKASSVDLLPERARFRRRSTSPHRSSIRCNRVSSVPADSCHSSSECQSFPVSIAAQNLQRQSRWEEYCEKWSLAGGRPVEALRDRKVGERGWGGPVDDEEAVGEEAEQQTRGQVQHPVAPTISRRRV
eukprot:3696144-Rhodomonas_salina.2